MFKIEDMYPENELTNDIEIRCKNVGVFKLNIGMYIVYCIEETTSGRRTNREVPSSF